MSPQTSNAAFMKPGIALLFGQTALGARVKPDHICRQISMAGMGKTLGFCTFGMFIIDEIEYGDKKSSVSTIMGGAGVYAALGARLAAGHPNAAAVSFIVDKGHDFPPEFQALIESWHTSVLFRTDINRLTTRAWNGYGPNQHRDFKYLTTKRRLETESLTDDQALAATFHMVCSPERCMSLVQSLRRRRAALCSTAPAPIIIWEPIPDLCTPAELANLREAVTYVDVISPNGEELAEFFASGIQLLEREEMIAALLANCGPDPRQTVVVRDGADGSRWYANGKTVHFRAYHLNESRVVDPTGGGNTYLGGLAMGLSTLVSPGADDTVRALSSSAEAHVGLNATTLNAIIHATVSASYAIEQVGLPTLDPSIEDCWNRSPYVERFRDYLCREGTYLMSQLETGQLE